jgi:hypothetical protein
VSESEVEAGMNGTNGFAMPLLGFAKIALPGVIGELAEQSVARAQQGCEKIKVASEEMTEALRETYSSNARSATDCRLKVFEIGNANTASAIDFFPSLGQQVSHGCRHLDGGASAQVLRYGIRPEQGIVGACREARNRNGRADQEALRQGSAPSQLKKRHSINVQGSSRGNPAGWSIEHGAPCSIKQSVRCAMPPK